MDVPWFYLGPLGRLVALPCPSPGIDQSMRKVSAQRQSMNARTTEDVRGYRREWTIEFPYLDAPDTGYLEALFTGAIRGPLRLLDPTRRNRLSLPASATHTLPQWSGGLREVAVSSGVLSAVTTDPLPEIAYTALDSREVSYAPHTSLHWQLSGTGSLTLDRASLVPLLRGETVAASAYVRTEDAANATLEIVPVSAAGELTAVTGTATSASTWTRLTASYSVPSGVFAAYLRVRTTSTTGVVRVAAAQLETGTAEPRTWTPGTGCPEVLITDAPATSPLYPFSTLSLDLREV